MRILGLGLILAFCSAPVYSESLTFTQPEQRIIGKQVVKAQVSQQEVSEKQVQQTAFQSLYQDGFSTLKTLPGVVSGGDFSALLYVRGGGASEILPIFDSFLMENPYYFGGLVSKVNPKLVDSITFYAGGFPARYGSVLSAVIDVKYKKGNLYKTSVEMDQNLTELNYLAQGPIETGRSSYLVNVRRTYYDLVMGAFLPKGTVFPFIESYYVKFYSDISPMHRFDLTMNYDHDGANLAEGSGAPTVGAPKKFKLLYDRNESDFHVRFQSFWLPDLTTVAGIGIEKTVINGTFGGTDVVQAQNQMEVANSAWPKMVFGEATYTGIKNNEVMGGVYGYYRDEQAKVSITEGKIPSVSGSVTTNREMTNTLAIKYLGVYLQDEVVLVPKWLAANVGARYEWLPDSRFSRSKSFEPRLSLYIGDRTQSVLTLSTGLYTSFHIPDIVDLYPEKAIHYNLGFEHHFGTDFLGRVELFYKDYQDLVREVRQTPLSPFEGYDNNRRGFAKGAEFFLQKTEGPDWDGYLTYTYSEVKYHDDTHGDWYYPAQDQRHTLNLVGKWHFGDMWTLLASGTVATGKPYTDITGGNLEAYTNAYNASRLPGYSNLDLWLEYKEAKLFFWTLKGKTYFGVHNVLNAKNVYNYSWDESFTTKTANTMLPIMPIFGVMIEF